MIPEHDFDPPIYLHSATLQSVLASSRLRTRNAGILNTTACDEILPLDDGVRLMARFSRQANGTGKGTVILIHGWEGSSESAYIVSLGRYLFVQGFSVVRLNLRDHGGTHHLNPGIFYATMIDESHQAVQRIVGMVGDLSGFSGWFFPGREFLP